MNISRSENFLILIFCALFFVSAVFLFTQNERELDPDTNKDWWVLSFAAPEKEGDLAFTVENHSDTTVFRYTLMADKRIVVEEPFELPSGKTTTITPTVLPTGKRISIIVTDGTEKKEIYR